MIIGLARVVALFLTFFKEAKVMENSRVNIGGLTSS